jgi:MFS family permease
MSDRLGRRWFFIVGNIAAIVGSIICATAQSVNVVIVGMTIGGVGAAGQHLALAAVSEIFSFKARGLAQGKRSIFQRWLYCETPKQLI